MELEEEKQQQPTPLQSYHIPTLFNTLDQSTTDHHPHRSRQFSSKREEELRPTFDTQDGQHSIKRNKQQQYHH